MQPQGDVVGLGNLARRMGDLVLGLLVFDLELAPVTQKLVSPKRGFLSRNVEKGGRNSSHRLGSMLLPSALRLSLRRATGERLLRWSALGAVMIWSQMTASLVALGFVVSGQVAVM